jgi:hypothetical protein
VLLFSPLRSTFPSTFDSLVAMPVQTIAHTKEKISLYMDERNTEDRYLWFKTARLDRTFCNRVIELQLSTVSKDQGRPDDPSAGLWSWFDIAILPHVDATEPVTVNDNKLVWRSHGNMWFKPEEPAQRQFGLVFDRHHDILNFLQVSWSLNIETPSSLIPPL